MKALQKQLKIIKEIADDAEKQQEYRIAQDPETLGAISVVEDFLKSKKRVCYGGQAINAHLPKKYKFYKDSDLPDYDFFTPNPDEDIDELVDAFVKKGFTEIGIRMSVHEGTTKLYINFLPMADITGIDDNVYKRLMARAMPYGGIYYADPDFLRMMMYLELSRPAGEVGRWEKVYERLFLLNTFQPMHKCKWTSDKMPVIDDTVKENILNIIINRGNVLAGLDVYSSYKSNKRRTLKWFTKNWPLVIYCEKPATDIKEYAALLKSRLVNDEAIKIQNISAVGEIVPNCSVLKYEEVPVVLCVKETACHAYMTLTLIGGKTIKVATIDTLITLFMSFMFHVDLESIVARPILCLVHEMILFSMRARASWTKGDVLPFLSIKCSGHQKQIASLLRERAKRVSDARIKKKKISQTKKVGGRRRNATRKNR